MNKKTKHLINSVLFGLTSIIYFFLAYIGYGKQNLDLSKYTQYENIITNKGIDIHYSSKGKESDVFFISLEGLNEDLGIYRMSKNYDDLLKKINIGDTIKVYYRPNSNEAENINIDLIQIEKNKKILISKDEYEKKESALIYIGLITGIGTLFMAFRYYKYGSVFKIKK